MSFPPLGRSAPAEDETRTRHRRPARCIPCAVRFPWRRRGRDPRCAKLPGPREARDATSSPKRRESVSWEGVRAGVLGKGGEGASPPPSVVMKTRTARQGLEACRWSPASQESTEAAAGTICCMSLNVQQVSPSGHRGRGRLGHLCGMFRALQRSSSTPKSTHLMAGAP